MLLFFHLLLFVVLVHPVFSFLECQDKAYLETNAAIGNQKLGAKQFPATQFTLDVWIRFSTASIDLPMGVMEYVFTSPGSTTET